MTNTDWVVFKAAPGGFILVCHRCDAEEFVYSPVPVTDFAKQADTFTASHAQCKEPNDTAP